MTHFYDSFNGTRTKFFQNHVKFNKFYDIDANHLKELQNEALIYKDIHFKDNVMPRDKYIMLLNYLITKKDYTYDEKLIFLISVFDPELKALNSFTNIVKLDKKEIEKLDPSNKKEELLEEYKCQFSKYELEVRKQIGFFEPNLYKIERLFQKYLLEKYTLSQNVKINALISFINIIKDIKFHENFILTNDEYENVRNICLEYQNNYPNYKVKDVFYHAINQGTIININNYSEIIVFLVELLDPTLSCFISYQEESTWKNMAERVDDTLAPYIKEIVELEKIYYKLYQPKINYITYN